MPFFTANGKKLKADLFVFDKDGLMFDSMQFWIELVNERCRNIAPVCGDEMTMKWAHLMGADTQIGADGDPRTTKVDPLGIFAVASPYEERTVTAGYFVASKGWPWHEARDTAVRLFANSDRTLDLRKALKPQPGFVELIHRLAELNVPYGVATSDTYDRVKDSMSLYNCWDKMQFVVTPEDVKEGKPAPDMLQLISKKTGISLNRIAMVGDSYVDVKMAHNAGSIGLGVSSEPEMREKMKPYATAVLNSLQEIKL